MKTDPLDALTRSLAGSFAFCGVGVAQGGARHLSLATAPGINADEDTMFRVASISKLVVGQAVAARVNAGDVSWDSDISEILGWPLRHPDAPDVPVTLGMVASHASGLSDDAGYVLPPDLTLQDWFASKPVFAAKPGSRFDYANLNYVVLATALEALTGQAFPDAFGAYLPQPGGFNWCNVPDAAATNRLPTFRSDEGEFLPQIDFEIPRIRLARNVGVFSPQGGLRISLNGMLYLAESLRAADATPLWDAAMGETHDPDGVFEAYGPGLQIFDHPRFYPRPLVGHFGNAYGFRGGVWYDQARDLSFAYALNGFPMGDESDAFATEELQIFEAVSDLQVP
ncbi:serine hydrolase domain-containing protein [Cognatiyoonia sp. IB215446]|uniref:serine hydrolase domain-containing protein n=1 Tax=Cognatiyoonia sp. IB215446 TaxID=3097355 RepID=UPI002A0C998E|nr:serine hydrolase domain-containing protein [Cognatiyoonia sp. IB215446]MDX8346692.1 serine hydrolase domain-containing protein [Cognatiyoonia sp. IB215446]